MDDKKIYALLLDSIEQDDKKTYFQFASIKRTSRISNPSISTSIDSYKVNYASFKETISEHAIVVTQLKQTLRHVKETIQLINCSTVFDLTYPSIVSTGLIVPSALLIYAISNLSEMQVINTNKQALIGAAALLSTAFCVYRNSRKVLREARLQRLKNYLEDFIEDSKQEQSLSIECDELVKPEAFAQAELDFAN